MPLSTDTAYLDGGTLSLSLSANHAIKTLVISSGAINFNLADKQFSASTATGEGLAIDEYYTANASPIVPSLSVTGIAGSQFNTGNQFDIGPGSTFNLGANVAATSSNLVIGYVDANNVTTRTATAINRGTWNVNAGLIGGSGDGALEIHDGAKLTATSYSVFEIGSQAGVNGSMLIKGAGSKFNARRLDIGAEGHGEMTVENGGTLTGSAYSLIINLGRTAGSTASLTLKDAGSSINAGHLDSGGGTGQLNVNGGSLVASFLSLGAQSTVNITGGTVQTYHATVGGGFTFTDGQWTSGTITRGSATTLGDGIGTAGSTKLTLTSGYWEHPLHISNHSEANGGLVLKSDAEVELRGRLHTTTLNLEAGSTFRLGVDSTSSPLLRVSDISGAGSFIWNRGAIEDTDDLALSASSPLPAAINLNADRHLYVTGALTIGNGASVNLATGGNLSAASIAQTGTGQFNYTGGVLELTSAASSLTFDSAGLIRTNTTIGGDNRITTAGEIRIGDRDLTISAPYRTWQPDLRATNIAFDLGATGKVKFASGNVLVNGDAVIGGAEGILDGSGIATNVEFDVQQLSISKDMATPTNLRIADGTTFTVSSPTYSGGALLADETTVKVGTNAAFRVTGGQCYIAGIAAGSQVQFSGGWLDINSPGIIGGDIVGDAAVPTVTVGAYSTLDVGDGYSPTNTGNDLAIASGATLRIDQGDVRVNGHADLTGGTLELIKGKISISGDAKVPNLTIGANQNAYISGTATMDAHTLTVADGGVLSVGGINSINGGTLRYDGGRLTVRSDSTLGAAGSIATATTTTDLDAGDTLGSHSAPVTLTVGAGHTLNLNNGGTLSAANLAVAPTGTLNYTGGTLELNSLYIGSGGLLGANVTIGDAAVTVTTWNQSLDLDNLTIGDGTTPGAGQLTVAKRGTVYVGGTTTISVGSNIAVSDGGSFGTWQLVGTSYSTSGSGTFNVWGTVPDVSGPTAIGPGTRFRVPSFGIGGGGVVNVNLGGILESAVEVKAGGRLLGRGRVEGSISNAGTVAPGASPGTLELVGDYTQETGGTLEIELGRTNSGLISDLLDINGSASLDGILKVVIDTTSAGQIGYTAARGDAFQFLSADTINGSFANYQMPNLGNGLFWYLVDSSAGPTHGLTLLVENSSFGGGTLIPEPAGLVLLALPMVLLGRRRRTH